MALGKNPGTVSHGLRVVLVTLARFLGAPQGLWGERWVLHLDEAWRHIFPIAYF